MNRTELLEIHDALCAAAKKLMEAKNHDYAGGDTSEDAFLNFTRVEDLGITTTELGFLVRMTDKLSRMITFVQSGKLKVSDESFKDTVIDMINYSVLLCAYVSDKGD